MQTVNGSATTNYSYDNAGQLLSTTVAGGATTNYGYDAAGRRTTAGSTSLTWDQQDRLLTYGSVNSYSYNATGLRVSKTVAGQSEAFVWDTADGMPLLLQDGSVSYVTGPAGLPLEQVSGSAVYYYQQDQLGSTRALTDAAGTAVASYSYDAFGNLATQTGSVSNPFLFSGQYRDAESGLYYLRARYYDPATGQFISRDPKLSSTWEPYGYVADNPLNATDPSGLCFGFGPSSNGICDFVRNNVSSAAHAVINWIGSEMHTPEGRLLSGMWSGYSLSISRSDDPWFNACEAIGVIILGVCMADGLGEALSGVRLVGQFSKFAKEGQLADDTIIVRGGTAEIPRGEVFSGAQGSTFEEAAAGVPNRELRRATVGDIRAAGGYVRPNPEFSPRVGRINYQHVDVYLPDGARDPFTGPMQNPVPKPQRFGGPAYPYYDKPLP